MYPLCLIQTLGFVWILWSWFCARGTLFEPYPLFMIAVGLFNGGQALLEVFGWNESGILLGHVSPEILVPALYLVLLGAAYLHFGALMALDASPIREARTGAGHCGTPESDAPCRMDFAGDRRGSFRRPYRPIHLRGHGVRLFRAVLALPPRFPRFRYSPLS